MNKALVITFDISDHHKEEDIKITVKPGSDQKVLNDEDIITYNKN